MNIMHILPAHKQHQLIANAVMIYRAAQDLDYGAYSTTHITLRHVIKELESYGISKERFERALDRTYGNIANW